MNSELLALFDAEQGIVGAVGAGGKKSVLYRLAAEHRGRLALTATVPTTAVPDSLGMRALVAAPDSIAQAVLAATDCDRLAYACPHHKPGRYGGVDPELVAALHERAEFDLSLVKADGARMRWLKAPQKGEPVLPPGCRTVIAVVSARAFGRPLGDRVAHRPDRVAAVTDIGPGEPVTPGAVARLFTDREGLLRDAEASTAVAVINMVDNPALVAPARETAEIVLSSTRRFRRFILTSMRRPGDPVVAIIER